MKLRFFALALTLSPMISMAVSTKKFETDFGQIKVKIVDSQNSRLEYMGTIKNSGKKVSCRIRSVTYKGIFLSTDCGKMTNKCTATFLRATPHDVVADVYADLGRPQGAELLGEISIGNINEKDQVTLNHLFKFKSHFVQERANFVEKLIGEKDRDYCAIEFQ